MRMKSIIRSLILLCVFAATFVSCETYSDPKVDYSPIYPLSGEWRVRIRNTNADTLVSKTSMYTLGTYNTSDNSTTQMWLRTTSNIPTFHPTSTLRTLKSKISCDVTGLSFSTTGIIQNLNVTTNAVIDTITITEGKVTLNSVSMPSGVMSDRISFKLKKSKSPGVTYLVDGYRRTRWNEDETFITFK
ncbi:lipid-binding putative hydrolase [Paludibacter jiangxiensis]|uniref:Lipid-binding putative hydrolase n=2 Tax=Paludibacter jiangxiensis TaxID=681398 RepID=A0A161LCX4_9BACT|nr:lipid-binding putative hydrolase [Paludibacter jiangxiensis]